MNLSPQQGSRQAIKLLMAGRKAEAEALAVQVLRLNPKDHTALYCLGVIAQSVGRFKDAEDLLRRAIASNGGLSEYHYNLSLALGALGKNGEALSALREAVRLEPGFQLAHSNLGGLLLAGDQLDEAEPILRRAVELDPKEPSAHANLGRLLRNRGRLDEAEQKFRSAIAVAPFNAQPWNMLGSCLREMGRVGEAIGAFQSALRAMPQFREAHSNLCYALHLEAGVTAGQILAEHREWARKFADPLREQIRGHANDRNPDRSLRVGYVSPDFRGHCQSLFTIPLFQKHDRSAVRVYCYSNVPEPDAMTAQIRYVVDEWRDISKLNDEQAADIIRADGIDLLVDLTLHMTGNRLPIFARRPAPVQMTWLGYPSTTGMSQIDYRISDPHLDGWESAVESYSEKTVRLPHTFWCYRPFEGMPEVNDLPASSASGVTFGCFNSFAKVNDPTLDLWAAVLSRVKGSSMVLRAPAGSSRARVTERLSKRGIRPERIQFVDRLPQRQYMQLYQRIDINLDTTPYTGHTTTLDSLWMGVPVVTISGETAVSRGSASILQNVGVSELIAKDTNQFADLATQLAGDLPRLSGLRRSLRERMKSSLLMNEQQFARDMEALYRLAWRSWCGRT
jgi:predicted O-linked N-acetylglucosamine transferase (SPINDLY family)